MIKKFCDVCGGETDSPRKFRYGCHMSTRFDGQHVKLIDGEMIAVFGRYDEMDVCYVCYNEILRLLRRNLQSGLREDVGTSECRSQPKG